MYPPEYFQADHGRTVAFIPLHDTAAVVADARIREFTAVDYAVATHTGSFESIDRTYGALGAFVAERAIGVDGTIRENYLDPEHANQIEVCWPIFRTEQP